MAASRTLETESELSSIGHKSVEITSSVPMSEAVAQNINKLNSQINLHNKKIVTNIVQYSEFDAPEVISETSSKTLSNFNKVEPEK